MIKKAHEKNGSRYLPKDFKASFMLQLSSMTILTGHRPTRALIYFGLLVLSYGLILQNELIGDDMGRIVNNPELNNLISALTGKLGDRPLLMFFLWIQVTVLGLGSLGLHVANLIWHTLVADQLAQLVDESGEKSSGKVTVAFAAGLLFALHPLHSQSINIVVQSGAIMAALFGIISLRYFLKAKFLLSFGALCLGMLCKPTISFLPLLYLISPTILGETHRKKWRWFPLFILPALFPVIFYAVFNQNRQDLYAMEPWRYFFTQMEVIFTYLRLMVAPLGLKYLYDFTSPEKLWPNLGWAYLAIYLVCIPLITLSLKEKIPRFLFIGFCLSFLPESSFFPIIHTAFEHRTYVPLLLIFATLGSWWNPKVLPRSAVITISLIALIYLGLNQMRNFQIRTKLDWMSHTLKNSVSHHNFNYGFNVQLAQAGRFEEVHQNIARYKKIHEESVHNLILEDIVLYSEKPDQRKAIAERLEKIVLHPWEGHTPRLDANWVLIGEFGHKSASLEDLLRLEEDLSVQMRIFFESHMNHYFLPLAARYPDIVARIFEREAEVRALKKDIELLKMKTILFYYYARPSGTIREEILTRLERDPSSPVLLRLKEMTEQSRRAPSP